MRWKESELQYLQANYKTESHENIGKTLGRTRAAVRNKCYELGYIIDVSWTDDEVCLLREYYEKAGGTSALNLGKIAETLRRDKTNVCRKAKSLGLATNKNRKSSDESRVKMCEAQKIVAANRVHPRGMLGKKHNDKFKQAMSDRVKKEWADKTSSFNAETHKQKQSDAMVRRISAGEMRRGYSRGKQGKRADLGGKYFRSSWEANFARYLNYLVKNGALHKWEYEPDTFWFEAIKRGTRSYLPDFKLWDAPESAPYYVEVKGWMDEKSKTKLSRMKKYYPEVKIVLFGAAEYKELSKSKELFDGWE